VLLVCDRPQRIRELARAHPHALLLAIVAAGEDRARALDEGAASVVRAGAEAELVARALALVRRAPRLTPAERALLECLASQPGRVFTKQELRAAIWGEQPPPAHGRALETQVARLRRQLGPNGPALVTVWGVGYRLG
jgi:two-component system response regulator TctD